MQPVCWSLAHSLFVFLLSWLNMFWADSAGTSRYAFKGCYVGLIHLNGCKVGNLFELDWVCVLVSEDKVLATMKKNSRDFLYPRHRPKSSRGPAEREILMTRSSSFHVGHVPSSSFSISRAHEYTYIIKSKKRLKPNLSVHIYFRIPLQGSEMYPSEAEIKLSVNMMYTICHMIPVGSVQVSYRIICHSKAKKACCFL